MNRTLLTIQVLAFAVWLGPVNGAWGQYTGSSTRSIYSATRNYLYNRPTVSPYLNLTTRDSSMGMSNYFTLVRPQLEAREQEVARQRQTAQMQAQLDQVENQVRQTQQDVASQMLTGRVGWSSRGYPRFGVYMNYYPGFQRMARR
jgi:hypothetical protein